MALGVPKGVLIFSDPVRVTGSCRISNESSGRGASFMCSCPGRKTARNRFVGDTNCDISHRFTRGVSNFSTNGLELLNQKHMSPSMEAVTEFHDHRWVDMGKLKDLDVASSWHFALKGY